MRKRIAVLILLVTGSVAVFAGNDTLESVYERFIERFADGNPAWKTEITLRADIDKPPAAPYRLHYNDNLGYYIYRPKRWAELNDYERFALKNDPRLPHFIREHALALRGGEFGGASNEAQPTSASDEISRASDTANPMNGLLQQEGQNTWGYRFDPDELLNTKPLRLVELPH